MNKAKHSLSILIGQLQHAVDKFNGKTTVTETDMKVLNEALTSDRYALVELHMHSTFNVFGPFSNYDEAMDKRSERKAHCDKERLANMEWIITEMRP